MYLYLPFSTLFISLLILCLCIPPVILSAGMDDEKKYSYLLSRCPSFNEKSCPRCVLCDVGSIPGLISAIWIPPSRRVILQHGEDRQESRLTVTSAAVTLASCFSFNLGFFAH